MAVGNQGNYGQPGGLGQSFNTGPDGFGFTGVPTGGGESTSQSSSQQSSQSGPVQTLQSELSALISQIAEGYMQQTYNWANNQIAPNTALTDQVVGNYLQSSNLSMRDAQNTSNLYNNTYVPEMEQMAQQAGEYGSNARAQVNAGQAESNSIQGSQAGINQTLSQLEGYGVDPSAGAFGSLLASQKTAQGAAAASAGTQASLGTQATGRQLLGQSVAVGEQQPGVEANFLNSNAAANAGASSAQLGNTSTQANAFQAATPFGTVAQNLTAPSTASSSQGSSQSSSQSQNFTQANVPQQGPHNIGAKGGAIPDNDSDDVPTQGGAIDASMSPSHGAITDDINAHVNSDEFIIPRDVALWKGQEFFQKLIQQSRAGLASAPAKPDNPAPPNHPDKPQVASREMHSGAIPA